MRIVLLGAVVLAALIWVTTSLLGPDRGAVTLVFNPTFGDRPLAFNRFDYQNPAGEEPVAIQDFRFFLSSIVLVGPKARYVEPESYHLARFDDRESGEYRIVLADVPLGGLEALTFSIGVDAAANGSLQPIGDLDPNSRMAWNWEVGYKFVLAEGLIRVDGVDQPLVYHVGFNENRRDLRFDAPKGFALKDGAEIRLVVDLRRMFAATHRIDMAGLPSVKFDREDARRLADNYADMITVDWN